MPIRSFALSGVHPGSHLVGLSSFFPKICRGLRPRFLGDIQNFLGYEVGGIEPSDRLLTDRHIYWPGAHKIKEQQSLCLKRHKNKNWSGGL